VLAEEHRLRHLDVPVTELVPEEFVQRVRRFVEAEDGELAIDFMRDRVEPREDPALDGAQLSRSIGPAFFSSVSMCISANRDAFQILFTNAE
jgi:hypothetical protein